MTSQAVCDIGRALADESITVRLATVAFSSILAISGSAHANDVQGDALRDLVVGTTWAAEDGWGFWNWQADNVLCVMTYSPDEDCTDTGPWTIEDDALCYELEWWGDAYALRENCFVIRALEDGRHEAVARDGAVDTAVFAFSVIE